MLKYPVSAFYLSWISPFSLNVCRLLLPLFLQFRCLSVTILNDLGKSVATFWLALSRHCQSFVKALVFLRIVLFYNGVLFLFKQIYHASCVTTQCVSFKLHEILRFFGKKRNIFCCTFRKAYIDFVKYWASSINNVYNVG